MLEPFSGFSSIFLESDARAKVSEPLCVRLVVSQFWFLFGGDFHGVSVFDVGDSGVDGRVCGSAVGKEGAVVEGKRHCPVDNDAVETGVFVRGSGRRDRSARYWRHE